MIKVVDTEHIEAIDITANAEVEQLFKQTRDGNYKFYRAVGQPRKLESDELQRKLYKYNELTKKGEPDGILEETPDKWFENPYYVSRETNEPEPEQPEPTVAVTVEVKPEEKPIVIEPVSNKEYDAVINMLTSIKAENDTLKAKVAEYKAKFDGLTAENTHLGVQLEGRETDLAQLKAELDKVKAENATLTEKVNSQREQLRILNEKVSTFDAQTENYEDRLAELDDIYQAAKTIAEFFEKAKKYDE